MPQARPQGPRTRLGAAPAGCGCLATAAAAPCGRPRGPGLSSPSAVGRGVHEAALGPQRVLAPLQRERRVDPDRAVVDLCVVADLLDDVDDEVGLEVEAWVEHSVVLTAGTAEEPEDVGVVALEHLIDVVARDAELLGLDRRDD